MRNINRLMAVALVTGLCVSASAPAMARDSSADSRRILQMMRDAGRRSTYSVPSRGRASDNTRLEMQQYRRDMNQSMGHSGVVVVPDADSRRYYGR